MKILFLTSRLPFPPVGGDKLRTFNFIKHLSRKHEVTLLSFIETEEELKNIDDYKKYYSKLITIKLPKLSSYINCLVGIISNKPLQIFYYQSNDMRNAVQQELLNSYDTIFCHLIRMSQYMPNNNSIHKVVDFTDAISLNYERSKSYRKGLFSIINHIEAKRVKQYENTILNKTDIAIFISEVDANFLKTDYSKDKIKIVENGVELDKFQYYDGNYEKNQIVFVGNMRTFPNTDAVLFFYEQILPLIKHRRPKIKFFIVGTEPNQKVKKLHNGKDVIVTGFVDSVIPYLNNSSVFIAPMRVGAGVQNKILEALAVGTPVVTSSIGAEGLKKSVLTIADTPEKFAEKIVTLSEDKDCRREKALNGRNYIEQNYSWRNVLSKLDRVILKDY